MHAHTCSGPQTSAFTCTYRLSLFLSHSHIFSLIFTQRRGAAHSSVRPASVLCWLLCVLVQQVLLMTLIQACFLHCVWAVALILGSLTRYTWPWACEITFGQLLLWNSLAHAFTMYFLLLMIQSHVRLCWVSVLLTLELPLRVGNDIQKPDKSVKCLSETGLYLSLFTESWSASSRTMT